MLRSRSNLSKLFTGRDWNYSIQVGGFAKAAAPYKLGMLKGNRFSVALRFVDRELSTEAI